MKPSAEVIKFAVDKQLQPFWPRVNGTFYDKPEALDRKQRALDQIAALLAKTTDKHIRKAQLYWVQVAQYTIERERIALTVEAKKINLPPITL